MEASAAAVRASVERREVAKVQPGDRVIVPSNRKTRGNTRVWEPGIIESLDRHNVAIVKLDEMYGGRIVHVPIGILLPEKSY